MRWKEDGRNLHQGKFSLAFRKMFFIEKVTGYLEQLPKEVVMAPNLSEYQDHLDDAPTHVV